MMHIAAMLTHMMTSSLSSIHCCASAVQPTIWLLEENCGRSGSSMQVVFMLPEMPRFSQQISGTWVGREDFDFILLKARV